MGEITDIHNLGDNGVELVVEEERGITKRKYLFTFVIDKEIFEKIKKEMEKK